MSLYAVGDIQGCYSSLRKLLDRVHFSPENDQLWCAGDLVNRGPESLATLRFLKSLGNSCIAVLGNHDLHLLGHISGERRNARDTFDELLHASDCDELITWLRHRPLFHHDAGVAWGMVHAGLHPAWSLATIKKRANEVEIQLQSKRWQSFCTRLQQPPPEGDGINDELRLLLTTAVMTRSRHCTATGQFNWQNTQKKSTHDTEKPWFAHTKLKWRNDCKVIFGHWAAMGIVNEPSHVLGLDSGCVWGGQLTLATLKKEGAPYLSQIQCSACLPI
ncbi:MAG: symmetrical bis(5'-nucleosyl)-tetraphosphatase [Mariprofundaceae bacterium]